MAGSKDQKSVFGEWFSKIDAKKRVKSVYKPCWEIRYCPYGPLIERFPLPEDEKAPRRCRITARAESLL